MALTRAEIQKNYRERKKAKDVDDYLEKERKRTKQYYVPSKELSSKARSERNKKKLKTNRKYRQRKKALLKNTTLELKFNFPNKAKGPKSRLKNTMSEQSKKLKDLEKQVSHYRNKYRSVMRQNQRQKKKETPIPFSDSPRSRAEKDLEEAGIDPNSATKLRRRLTFSYAINEELKQTVRSRRKNAKKMVETVIGSRILRKYKLLRIASKEFGINRRRLAGATDKILKISRKKRSLKEQGRYKDMVINFMERCDNTVVHPNKQEVKDVDGSLKAKRVLTDYIDNLYDKFRAENPEVQISRATFFRCRPSYILPVQFTAKISCLCIKHQNMTLMMKALKSVNGSEIRNVDNYFRNTSDGQIATLIDQIEEDRISYSTWKRVDIGDGKKKVSLVIIEKSKQEFKDECLSSISQFREHMRLVNAQYTEIKKLKDNLPQGHVVAQLDFSENYSCSSIEEVQSAYWNQTMVTIHPVVIYYKAQDEGSSKEIIHHKSYSVISDEMNHTASTVNAFLRKLIPMIVREVPNMTHIHYVSDSLTSQYRNKFMFDFVVKHEETFAVKASWQYFEAGHGKGPCDGIGAVVKRMADNTIKRNKQVIQDASSFYSWAESSESKVTFVFVSKETCAETDREMRSVPLIPVKGTLSVHSVFPIDINTVATRKISCFDNCCFNDGQFRMGEHDDQWTKHILRRTEIEMETDQSTSNADEARPAGESDQVANDPNINDFVAAMYNEKWYLGKIMDIDPTDKEIYISFMNTSDLKGQLTFRWPRNPDELWVANEEILCSVDEPQVKGTKRAVYRLKDDDLRKIQAAFDARK